MSFYIQVLHVPKLSRVDFESWLCTNPLQRLESLIIFKVFASTYHTIDSFTQGQSQYTSCHTKLPGSRNMKRRRQILIRANARLFCSFSSSFPLQLSQCTKPIRTRQRPQIKSNCYGQSPSWT